MATNRSRVVHYKDLVSIRGQEFTITIFRAATKDGSTIYGVKPQVCKYLKEKREFMYSDLFRTVAWLQTRDLQLLIASLLELADPPGVRAIIDKLKETPKLEEFC
jgi:hypothetical protein